MFDSADAQLGAPAASTVKPTCALGRALLVATYSYNSLSSGLIKINSLSSGVAEINESKEISRVVASWENR